MPNHERLVLSPALAGRFDGIGDYSERLAAALSVTAPASLVGRGSAGLPTWLALSDDLWRSQEFLPSAVCLQYYPHAFPGGDGRAVIGWLRNLRRRGVPVITTMHAIWPPLNGSLRRAGARFVLRRQARRFITHSSHVVCTQERNIRELAEAGLIDANRVRLIPVGSNIERGELPPMEARSAHTLTLFGQPAAFHGPTMLAIAALLARRRGSVTLRWLNRSKDEARRVWSGALGLPDTDVEFFGGLDIPHASAVLVSGHLALAPYVDGVSTRRTTLVAHLQHGRPVAGTDGESTGVLLRDQRALLLSPVGDVEGFIRHVERLLDDPAAGAMMAKAARALYEAEFAWPRIAAAYTSLLLE